jgi:hypothetical protein
VDGRHSLTKIIGGVTDCVQLRGFGLAHGRKVCCLRDLAGPEDPDVEGGGGQMTAPSAMSPLMMRLMMRLMVCRMRRGKRASAAEQREVRENLLKLQHLAGYEFGDREGDDLRRIVDVGHHTAGLCAGEATPVGTQAQLDLVSVYRVETSKWTATFVAPV